MRSDIKVGFWKTQNIFFRLDGQYCSLSMGNGSSSFPPPIYFTKYIAIISLGKDINMVE